MFLRSALRRSEGWLDWQVQILAALEAASERWFDHRGRDFERSMAALQQLSKCRDLGEAVAIQQRWGAECARSLTADWVALMGPVAPRVAHGTQDMKKVPISVMKVADKMAA